MTSAADTSYGIIVSGRIHYHVKGYQDNHYYPYGVYLLQLTSSSTNLTIKIAIKWL